MYLINLYLSKSIVKSMLITWFTFIGLSILFGFLAELGSTNETYNIYSAFWYSVLVSAQFAVQIFPLSLLVGTVFSLGKLSSQSELTIIFTAGVSILKMLMTILSIASVLLILVIAFKEIVVPKSEQLAKKLLRSKTPENNWFHATKYGAWMIQDNKFLHIEKMKNSKNINNLSIFSYNKNDLVKIQKAQKAYLGDNGMWSLFSVTTIQLSDKNITQNITKKIHIKSDIEPGMIEKINISYNLLSTTDLLSQYSFLNNNHLNTQGITQELWQRLAYPFSALVMLFFAFPLVLKSNRTSSLSQKISQGISLAIAFFVFNEIIKQLGIIYGAPHLIISFTPALIFFFIGLRLYKKIIV